MVGMMTFLSGANPDVTIRRCNGTFAPDGHIYSVHVLIIVSVGIVMFRVVLNT